MRKDILIVDDEPDIRRLIRGILEDEGYSVREAGTSALAYEEMRGNPADLIIQDIWLQGSEHDGLEILSHVKKTHPHTQVIMISGHGTVETAVSSIKKGAYDFIQKPFKSDRLILMVRRALEAAALQRENENLRNKIDLPRDFIGDSEVIVKLRQDLKNILGSSQNVLITGEVGTGKTLTVQHIYESAKSGGKPFVTFNCANINDADKLEIALFGEAADELKTGLIEQSNGGLLYLDEVSLIPREVQAKLAQVIKNGYFSRCGDKKKNDVEFRIIAATNKDTEHVLDDAFKAVFLEHLYLPELKDYASDIPKITQVILKELSAKLNFTNSPKLSKESIEILQNHDWPGNLRELHNVLEHILIKHVHLYSKIDALAIIEKAHFPTYLHEGAGLNHMSLKMPANDHEQDVNVEALMDKPLREAREEFERTYLEAQLNAFDGHISNMASFVGMERSALHRKLKSLNIKADLKSKKEG